MFIRMVTDAVCQYYYWYDREPLNQWSSAEDYRRTSRQETLERERAFTAIEVRPDGSEPGHCRIVTNDGEHESYYARVPWDSIEIFNEDPNTTKHA